MNRMEYAHKLKNNSMIYKLHSRFILLKIITYKLYCNLSNNMFIKYNTVKMFNRNTSKYDVYLLFQIENNDENHNSGNNYAIYIEFSNLTLYRYNFI